MRLLYAPSIRWPKTTVILFSVVVLAAAPGVLRLRLRTDGHALIPTNAPEIATDRAIRDAFGVEDPLVVLIRTDGPDGIFNAHTIALVQQLTDEFRLIEGIRPFDLFSLATEHGDRVRPGTLYFRRFLEPPPTSREDLNRLRDDLRAVRLYNGTLVSRDESATSILIGVPHGVSRDELLLEVKQVIAEKQPLPERIDVIGAPVAEALLGLHILEDLGVPDAILGYSTHADLEETDGHWPGSVNELRRLIARSVGLVPVAIFIMAGVFLLSFRSLLAVTLPLMEVGACLAFVFGLMGWLDVPVYLTIAVLPVILTAIGIADEIHIFARYRDHLRNDPTTHHVESLKITMREMWVPVVKTSGTTAVGFLSFALSPIGPVRAFGIFTSIGILFCMLWSLTVIPAMLAMIRPRHLTGRRPDRPRSSADRPPLFARTALAVARRRGLVIGVAAMVTIVAPFGVRRIQVQDSWINGFAQDSDFYRTTQYFNEQFLGTHILLVLVDAGHHELSGEIPATAVDFQTIALPADIVEHPRTLVEQRLELRLTEESAGQRHPVRPSQRVESWSGLIESVETDGERILLTCSRQRGIARASLRLFGRETLRYTITPQPMMRPSVLRRIEALESFIEGIEGCAVGGVIGTADYLATANYMSRARKEEERAIPDNPDRIQWVWGQYERIRGQERRNQIVDSNYARSLVTVFMNDANFVGTGRLMDEIRDYEKRHLAPHGMKLEFAGDVAVSQTLIEAIVETQTVSLLLSLVGIFVITAIMARSVAWGLLSVVPCALAVLINFAAMGVTGMPLGVATSMFAGMTLGIGVDYAIHLLERYRFSRDHGLDAEAALVDATSSTGPAIVIDALAVALGFGILTLSQVPANARLGALVVLSILVCLVATLVLLPALLSLSHKQGSLDGAHPRASDFPVSQNVHETSAPEFDS